MERIGKKRTYVTSIFATLLLGLGVVTVTNFGETMAAPLADVSIEIDELKVENSTSGNYNADPSTWGTHVDISSGEYNYRTINAALSITSNDTSMKYHGIELEACLPYGVNNAAVEKNRLQYQKRISNGAMPMGSTLNCDDGETYLRTKSFGMAVNQGQVQMHLLLADMLNTAESGDYDIRVKARSSIDNNVSSDELTQEVITYTRSEDLLFGVTAPTSVLQSNRLGNGVRELAEKEYTIVNNGSSDVGKVRMVDMVAWSNSDWHGNTLESVDVTKNTANMDVNFYYTTAHKIQGHAANSAHLDPNSTRTDVAWCDSPDVANAKIVYPLPRAGEDCPTHSDAPTGILMEAEGSFKEGDELNIITKTNYNEEVFNSSSAVQFDDADELVRAHTKMIVDSAYVHGFLWEDNDRDGLVDDYEERTRGAYATLTGTDDLGNEVFISSLDDAAFGRLTHGDIGSAERRYDVWGSLREGTYDICVEYPEELYSGITPEIGHEALNRVNNNMEPSGCTEMVIESGEVRKFDIGLANKDAAPMGGSSISGSVWEEAPYVTEPSSLGRRDTDEEKMVPNVPVLLTGYDLNSNRVSRESKTNEYGNYKFENVSQGNYTIEFVPPEGYIEMAYNEEDYPFEGKPKPNGIHHISLQTTTHITDMNVGVYKARTPRVSGAVWDDSDMDGHYLKNAYGHSETDASMPGVNVTIRGLEADNEDVEISVETDANGEFILEPGKLGRYEVEFEKPAGYAGETRPFDASEYPDYEYSSIEEVDGRYISIIELVDNENLNNLFAGFVPENIGETSSINGTVWMDDNADGIMNNGEQTLSNIGVEISGVDYTSSFYSSSAITAQDGSYSLDSVPPGSYTLKFENPEGTDGFARIADANSIPHSGRVAEEFVWALGYAGKSAYTIDIPHGRNAEVNAGALPRVKNSLGGIVWEDTNDNGILDEREKGIEGVEITMMGATIDGDYTDQVTITTDSEGKYLFEDLTLGGYSTMFDMPDHIQKFSRANVRYDDSVDSDVKSEYGSFYATHYFSYSTDRTTMNAGMVPDLKPSDIGSIVWEDSNENGIRDVNEKSLSGVAISLTGEDIFGNEVNKTSITNNDGEYRFKDVIAGDYTEKINAPDGYSGFSPQNQGGDEDRDSDANDQGIIDVPLYNDSDMLNLDVGLIPTKIKGATTIGDRIWRDVNENGIQDEGETSVPGISMELTGATADGESVSMSTVSGPLGKYYFEDVEDGDYSIKVTLPEGDNSSFSPQSQGNDSSLDSNANSDGVISLTVSSDGSEVDSSVDVGLVPVTGSFVS